MVIAGTTTSYSSKIIFFCYRDMVLRFLSTIFFYSVLLMICSYRYNSEGIPTECCLLDLQVTRVGSPALDMNYMLYCSLNGDVRKPNLKGFFAHYYCSFSAVLSKVNKPVPFTLQELEDEFYDKSLFGLLMGMTLIPIVLVDPEDAPSLDNLSGSNTAEAIVDFQDQIMKITLKSPLLMPRFLSMFDEMNEKGLFDENGKVD